MNSTWTTNNEFNDSLIVFLLYPWVALVGNGVWMLFAQLKMVTRLGGMQGKEHPAKLEVVKWLDQILHARRPWIRSGTWSKISIFRRCITSTLQECRTANSGAKGSTNRWDTLTRGRGRGTRWRRESASFFWRSLVRCKIHLGTKNRYEDMSGL